ncbi:hypothetical protein [Pseudomonas sp. NPDC089569]|uniref:hypothetical protein n=1 Tax=Pseudomonas sp. NPDC089569 TaxID=3390722 RepID=UPI003D0417BB
MTRTVNQSVLEHFLEMCQAELRVREISISLIKAAGDVFADLMLDIGYQVESTFIDGRDVVQTYFNPRTGGYIEGLAFTLGLTSVDRGVNLHVLLRVNGPGVKSCAALSSAVREARGWYQPLNSCATALDVLNAVDPGSIPVWKTEPAFQWQVAA